MAEDRNRGYQTDHDNRLFVLVCRRWADLVFLFFFALAVGMVLCPFLERVQSAVTNFLASWGWAGGLFVGLVAATSAWAVLGELGVSLNGPSSERRWITNPPAWPLAIPVFLTCSFIWHCVLSPRRADSFPLLLQVSGAVVLLLIGRVLAVVVVWAQNADGGRPLDVKVGEDEIKSLDELADKPEEMIEWLKREEPISDPKQDCFDMVSYARRIAELLRSTPLRTVALIGPYGCGKSSIAKMVQCYLGKKAVREACMASPGEGRKHFFSGGHIIVAEVSGWGFREGTVAEHILDVTISAISKRVDCLELASIPASYERMLSGSGGWLSSLYALLGGRRNCSDILRRIDNVLLRADMRMVVFLEDVDRSVREETFLNEVAALLESLKGLDNMSFVLAIGEKYQGQDIAAKLGEHIEIVPPPARQPILHVLRSFRERCLEQYSDDITVLTVEEREERTRFMASDNLDHIAEVGLIQRPIDSVAGLLTSPRILKTSLRRTWFAWERLHGEIDFEDLLLCNVLRAAATEAFLLLNENVARLRSLSDRAETEDAKKRDDENRHLLTARLEKRGQKGGWDVDAVREVTEFLFPGFKDRHVVHTGIVSPQGVHVAGPTDYWARLNREEISDAEIRDQRILRAMEMWRANRNSEVFETWTMPKALLEVDGFADKIEQFGQLLDGKEVRDLASGLFSLIRESDTIAHAVDYPGFVQLWRISLSSEFESHENWVMSEISRTLPVSLRFANDIYYCWRSEQASHRYPTPELRNRVVQTARDTYGNNARAFVNALDPDCPGSTHALVAFHGSQEHGGPGLDSEDWLWFGPILLAGASVEKKVVVPQIAVLLTEHDASPGRHGSMVHRCVFNDSIAKGVFGQTRMRDLMELLSRDFDLETRDPEMSSHLACCKGRAAKWLRENREQSPENTD